MKKVKMISTCALLAMVCIGVGGLSLKTASANAVSYEGFEMDGASIRMVEPTGIRFHTNVPEAIKDSYTFGTLMIPVADLGDNELTVSTPNVANMVLGENGKWQAKEENKPWTYTSVLAGVEDGESILAFPKSQYNAQIAARSYALDENGNVVYYTTTETRSVAYVASCALATTEGDGVITDETDRATLTGMVDYVLGEDEFVFASDSVKIVNKNKINLAALFAEVNGNEGMTAIWEVAGDCLSLEYDANGIVTGAIVNGEGSATLSATIGSTTKELNVTVDLTEWYQQALQFNNEDSIAIVENSYVKGDFAKASIVKDGKNTVLSACLGAKAQGGYNSTLAIGIGGKYKASEIANIVITLRVPELTGSAGSTFYKAGANVTSSSSSSEISISSASVSNGTAKPTVTSDYITIPITGEQLTTALGSGDTIVNNIALWNSKTNSTEYPVHVYIDSIVINLVQTTPIEKDLLQFDDKDSLAIVENSYINSASGFNAASIIADGNRTVLSASLGAKSKGGYASTLTIGIGGKYKASEIESIVITLRVPELTGSAGSTFYKAGANVTASSSSSEISISSTAVSNGTAKPTVTSDYITIPITGAQLATALGSGDTVVNNIALWNNTSGGEQYPVHVYIDSIVINLA